MAKQAQPVADKAFERLSDILDNGVDIHRCVAAQALGQIAYPGSAEVLQKALLDEDEDVRADVVAALAEIADPETGAAVLENLLGDPCPEVKLAAIGLLARLNHQEALPWMLKLISEQSEEINWDESAYYASGWDDWLDIQKAAIKAVGEMGAEAAIPEILKAMDDEEGQDLNPFAIPVLARFGYRGFVVLKELFATGNSRVRRGICAVLEFSQSDISDEILVAGLSDQSGDVRYVGVEKLLEHDANDQRLVAFFDDGDADIRKLIINHLGTAHPAKVMESLADKEAGVRQVAFRVIANEPEYFEKDGFSEVVRTAIAGVPEVAGDAAVAWACLIGEPSANSLGQALQNPKQPLAFRMGLIEALTLLDDAGFPFLAEAAGDENRQVRVSALTALAEIAKDSAWPNNASETLLAALRGDLVEPQEQEVQETAPEDGEDEAKADSTDADKPETDEVEAVDSDAAEASTDIADEQEALVEETPATSTLDQIVSQGLRTEAPDDGEPLQEVELSQEDERFIEISKLRAMKKGKVSLDVKIAPHQDVRRFAARLLGDFNETGLSQHLVEALSLDDDELKQSVLESLGLIGLENGSLDSNLCEAIVAETRHNERSIRMYGARCLGFVADEKADQRLLEMCDDKDVHVRLEAIKALARKGGFQDLMLKALEGDYSGIRMAGARGLENTGSAMDRLIALTLVHDGMHRKDVVDILQGWNARQAAEKYLAILDDEEQKRVWLVAIAAIGDLLSHTVDEKIQAVA